MKKIFWSVILISFNSLAGIEYNCGKDSWNRAQFQNNFFFAELEVKCLTNLSPEVIGKINSTMISRFQNASDVVQVHEVGQREYEGLKGTYIVSNLKQSIPNRGEMNVKFFHFVGSDNNLIQTTSQSQNIEATGYSRFTKEIIRRRIFSLVNGKVQITFRDFNKIQKPGIAPRRIFERTSKKGLSKNLKRKINFLMTFLDQNL
jgi:hypothetical protein